MKIAGKNFPDEGCFWGISLQLNCNDIIEDDEYKAQFSCFMQITAYATLSSDIYRICSYSNYIRDKSLINEITKNFNFKREFSKYICDKNIKAEEVESLIEKHNLEYCK